MRINTGAHERQRSSRLFARLTLILITLLTMTSAMAADWAYVADVGSTSPSTDAVRLNDGRVLYGVKLYEPATGQWSATTGAGSGYLSTLTLLDDGRVLKVGHYDLFWFGALPYTQLFDPSTNTWTDTTDSNYGHGGHLAVKLADGRILIAGIGRDGGKASEIFDPATETWTVTGNMNEEHVHGFIELLDNGKVMVGGGTADYGSTTTGIELYDPATGSWTSQANAPGLLHYTASARLHDGRILMASQSRSYLYNSATNSWTNAAALNVEHNGGFLLTTLADGQVLIAGGYDLAAGEIGNAAEIYSPLADTWTRISDMPENRYNYGAALLQNGHVLLTGGMNSDTVGFGLASAILYTPPGTPAPPVLPPPPPPPAPTPIHIGDIDNVTGSASAGATTWVPEVMFTVVDDKNNPITGALVTGKWSNGLTGTASCSTINNGTCTIYNLSYPKIADVPNPVFTVTDVSQVDMVYDPSANSDPDSDSDGTTIVVTAPTPPPPPPPAPTPSTVAIGDLDGSSATTSKRRWQATVTIVVVDDVGNRVSNTTVRGSWSGGYSGSGSCTTDGIGTCKVASGEISRKKSSATFTVSDIINYSGLTYNAALNSDPDGDSNGTSISVYKP